MSVVGKTNPDGLLKTRFGGVGKPLRVHNRHFLSIFRRFFCKKRKSYVPGQIPDRSSRIDIKNVETTKNCPNYPLKPGLLERFAKPCTASGICSRASESTDTRVKKTISPHRPKSVQNLKGPVSRARKAVEQF